MTDWSKLKTAKGKATWVPERLEVLRRAPGSETSAARDKAFRKLGRDLFNGSKWQSAAPATVAALVELVLEGAPERHRILALLARLVTVRPSPFLVSGFDLRGDLKKKYARGTAKKVHAALWEKHEEIAALLDDDDPKVRAAVAFLLLFHGRDAEGTAQRLGQALASEADPLARATMVYVLGLCVGMSRKSSRPTQVLSWLASRRSPDSGS